MRFQRGMVRNATAVDLPGLKAVIDACGLFPPEMLESMMETYLSGDPTPEFWVTVRDPTPIAVGYCAPERMTQGTWNMLLIAVHPARQGQGVGAAITREVETRLAIGGGRLLLVETSGLAEFSGTRAFYRHIGYDGVARIRDFYQAGEDKVVYCKSLTRVIRPATETEVEMLQAIEIDAAQSFAPYREMQFCLTLPDRSSDEHRAARENGIALVAEVNGVAEGFLLALPKDGRAHLLEIAVRQGSQGRGLGRVLIEELERWAAEQGLPEATLTTFRDVPWNAPFYARLGYQTIDVGIDCRELLAVIDEERSSGVHGAPRLVMSKKLVAG